MQKLCKLLLLSAVLIIATTSCKTETIKLKSLTREAKHSYSPNTKIYITDIPCSSGNTDVCVQLICSSQVNKKISTAITTFFLSPIYTKRNGSNGKYTYTYQYDLADLRDFTDVVGCHLKIVTTSYPNLSSTYHTQDVKDYYFEIKPLKGIFSWVNFWS